MKNFNVYIAFLVLFSAFVSCSPKLAQNTNTSSKSILYPTESDTARVQFLTSISNSLAVTKQQSSFTSSIVGEQQIKEIAKPYGVSIRDGKVYVCDVTLRAVAIIDLDNKTFDYMVPKGKQSFALPLNSFIDQEGKIYVVDTNKHLISVFNQDHNIIAQFGEDTNINPTDIFIKNGKIYVVDAKGNRVNMYDHKTNEFIDYFPKTVAGNDDHLYTPTNIFITNERIYVSDLGATNVKIYDLDGKHVKNIGSLGAQIGKFVRPKGIAADKEEILYVVDAAFEQIQMFNKKGELLMFFGGPYDKNRPGGLWLPTQMTIDYENIKYFQQYVDPKYDLKYIILVANQFGPDKINIYGRVDLKK
ncbi:6-bladed beta-propeller [Lutimonas zeaxanthinifaciens]|uniref:6-bladed beta-propeller n=1 Tax=Lutimonas zeaxanthinifaciens TaxID=3060215 RepID=UPI00265CF197|nr:6-bladed beta-propeller [Lutimonas sp. YSD2104]WKK67278.1 6-bladed beta-propeller [Lutimonas sp. YSD2104]